jgi:hypothetical protein
MTIAVGISAIALLLALVSYLSQRYTSKDTADILQRLTALETKVELWWGAVAKRAAEMLKDWPTNPSKDILIEKFIGQRLTKEEAEELRCILLEERKSARESVSLAYTILLASLDTIVHGDCRKC